MLLPSKLAYMSTQILNDFWINSHCKLHTVIGQRCGCEVRRDLATGTGKKRSARVTGDLEYTMTHVYVCGYVCMHDLV